MDDFLSEYMHIPCVGDFVDELDNLDEQSFAEAHGHAFLMHHGALGKLQRPRQETGTLAVEGAPRPGVAGHRESFLVFPVRQSAERSASDDRVWVGRVEGCDIVIPDASISSVHAFFWRDPEGTFLLADNDSTNGSFVEDKRVPGPRGREEPVVMHSGMRVRFGSVNLTWLTASAFRDFLQRLAGE